MLSPEEVARILKVAPSLKSRALTIAMGQDCGCPKSFPQACAISTARG